MIRRKQNIIQIILILTGILLIFLTYIFYPKIKQSSIIPSDLIEKESKKGTSGQDLALKIGEYVKDLSKGLSKLLIGWKSKF